jgi:hypothetical protein
MRDWGKGNTVRPNLAHKKQLTQETQYQVLFQKSRIIFMFLKLSMTLLTVFLISASVNPVSVGVIHHLILVEPLALAAPFQCRSCCCSFRSRMEAALSSSAPRCVDYKE